MERLIRLLPLFCLAFAIQNGLAQNCCAQSKSAPQAKDLNTQAEQAYARGKYAETLRLAEERLKEEAEDAQALYLKASALIEIGRRTARASTIRQGVEDARKAIELSKASDPKYYLPYLYGMTSLTELEKNNQHAETALEIANKLVSATQDAPTKANVHYQRARIHSLLGDHKKAQSDYRDSIRLNDKFLASYMGLTDSFMRTKELDRAREAFDDATRKFPKNPVVFNNRGLFLQQRKEYELAIVDFTKALQINKQFVAAYTNRGYTLLQMDDPEAAELDFGASLGLAPQQPLVHRLRAGCRLLQKQPALAIEDLTAAVRLRADAVTFVDLGFAQLINRNYDAAAKSLEEAEKLDPAMQHVHPWRFAAMTGLKQKAEAIEQYAAPIARVKTEKDAKWSDQLVGYLSDTISTDALMKVAGAIPDKKVGRMTEANFFLGVRSEMRGDLIAAAKYYKQSLLSKRKDLAAYRGALVGLERTTKKK